jgi:hypothetical protein
MKKTWIIIAILMLASWSMAEDAEFDFLPSPGMLALGKIVEFREEHPSHWIVEVTHIKMLLYNSGLGKTEGNKIMPIPDKMTIKATTGWGGALMIQNIPPDWVGRIVLFSGLYRDGCVTVTTYPSPGISPFAFYDESTARLIEQIASILKLSDSSARLQKLKDVIQSPTEPLTIVDTDILIDKGQAVPEAIN